MNSFKKYFQAIAVFICTGGFAIAQNPDVINEPVSYDFVLRQSLKGNIPLGHYSVFPLSLKKLKSYQSTTTDEAFKKYIYDYYAPIIDSTSGNEQFGILDNYRGRLRGVWYTDSLLRAQADVGGMLQAGVFKADESEMENVGLGRVSGRVMGNYAEMFEFFFDFSNGKRIVGNAETARIIDPFLQRSLKFNIEKESFYDNYIGYVQAHYKDIRVRFGRENISHGYSPIDNLVFSLKSAPVDGLLIDLPYKWLRFTSTHAAVEGTNQVTNQPVSSKFIATHRVTIDPVDWLSFSASEMMIYSGRGVDFTYLNPLAFLVSAGLGTSEKSNNDNSILGADIAVRPFKNSMIYGVLVADDINFATLDDSTNLGNDNKYAFQVGTSYLMPDDILPLLMTVEYVRITPFTFSHRYNQNSWTTQGTSIGYNMQPNSDRLALQLKYWFSPRTSLTLDADYTRHGENFLDSTGRILMNGIAPIGNIGGDILRGDGDFLVGNKFLKGNVSHMRRIGGILSAEFFPNFFTDIAVHYESRNGGNSPVNQWWGRIQARIGY